MTTLRNFQSEIEEIHAHELARQRTQGVRVLSSHDGQRREPRVPGVSELYEQSDMHSSEQEERILVSHSSVVIHEHLDVPVSIGTARCT